VGSRWVMEADGVKLGNGGRWCQVGKWRQMALKWWSQDGEGRCQDEKDKCGQDEKWR